MTQTKYVFTRVVLVLINIDLQILIQKKMPPSAQGHPNQVYDAVDMYIGALSSLMAPTLYIGGRVRGHTIGHQAFTFKDPADHNHAQLCPPFHHFTFSGSSIDTSVKKNNLLNP